MYLFTILIYFALLSFQMLFVCVSCFANHRVILPHIHNVPYIQFKVNLCCNCFFGYIIVIFMNFILLVFYFLHIVYKCINNIFRKRRCMIMFCITSKNLYTCKRKLYYLWDFWSIFLHLMSDYFFLLIYSTYTMINSWHNKSALSASCNCSLTHIYLHDNR